MRLHHSDRDRRRQVRHRRLRKKVIGSAQKPRLCVSRSHKHLYAQLVDDWAGRTLLGCSTQDERLQSLHSRGNVAAAESLGKLIAQDALKAGILNVVFDRGGYVYHGRVKAFADAIRSGGLKA